MKYVEVDQFPKCPHCEKELNTVYIVSKGFIEQMMAFFCPFCQKLLSIGYNLGW